MKRIVRITGAVVAGYVVIVVIVIVGVFAAASLLVSAGENPPGSDYMIANLAVSFLAAIIGGYTAATVGKSDGLVAVLSLATLVIVLGLVFEAGGSASGWYTASLPWIGAAGVIAGGAAKRLHYRNRQT